MFATPGPGLQVSGKHALERVCLCLKCWGPIEPWENTPGSGGKEDGRTGSLEGPHGEGHIISSGRSPQHAYVRVK